MSQTSTTSQLFGQLSEFMEEIQAEKSAAHEKDPGGHDGPSSHPSADVDDSLADASEGARSAENSSDVKADVGGKDIDSTPEASPGSGDENQLNLGLSQSSTGEDPAVEDDFKGEKDDPGTAAVADVKDGEKYGELAEKYASVSFAEASDRALTLGNEILASFANGAAATKQATAQGNPTQGNPAQVQPEAEKSAEAGYALAAALGMEKMSSDERVSASIEQTIKDAQLDADLVGGYLSDLANSVESYEKGAEGELPPELLDPTGGAAEGDVEGEPSGMEEGGDEGMEELLGEEEPMMGGEEEPMMGGDDLGAEDVEGVLGGLEGPPDEGLGEEEALQELAMALDELGIAPEDLVAAAEGGGGEGLGGEGLGGEGLGAGGGPELPMEVAAECKKLASAVQGFKRSGKFRLKSATNDRERKIRDLMKAHVMELVG
jgi:hypothetical protein